MADHTCGNVSDPDNCFRCKIGYWRDNGAPPAHYQGGRIFHESTIANEQRRLVAQAKAKGNDIVPYHSIYGS